MKILILGVPRSGTTSMFKSFQNEFKDWTSISEPWVIINDTNKVDIDSHENLLIKTQIYQQPNLSIRIKEEGIRNYQWIDAFDFYKSIIPKFDKVILLNRKNSEDAAISYSYSFGTHIWQQSYKPVIHQLQDVPLRIGMYGVLNKRMERIRKEFGLKIWYYEDLYHENNSETILSFIDDLNIPIRDKDSFLNYYNTKNRLRIL